MKKGREPVPLADLVISSNLARMVDRDNALRIKDKIRRAHRFVFDEDASRQIAEVGVNSPDLLIKHHEFARAPYDLCWVQIDPLVTANTARRLAGINERESESGQDVTLGWLFDHGTVYTFVPNDNENDAVVSPYVFRIHTPWVEEDELLFQKTFGVNKEEINGFMWGAAYNVLNNEQRCALRQHHSISKLPGSKFVYLLKKYKLINSAAGDLRNAISTLMILNRPSLVTYVRDVPTRRSFLHGKLHNYLSHQVVTIHTSAREVIRRIGTNGDVTERCRHEVRGHWCHNHDAHNYEKIAGCIHEWTNDPEHPDEPDGDRDHWICSACGGKRWWRNEHFRGSAERGFKTKEYRVEA